MSGTTENMRKKIGRTEDLGTVVHTMKAMAASKIGQYEESVRALEEYYRTVVLGLAVCLGGPQKKPFPLVQPEEGERSKIVVFGSDQGLVGKFNEALSEFVLQKLDNLPGDKQIWVVGERIFSRLTEADLSIEKQFSVPGSVDAITPLIGQLLVENEVTPFYIFHNRPKTGATYEQHLKRLLPLDQSWIREMTEQEWPTNQLPGILGEFESTLRSLVREYLFVTLFKACAESLTAENASRLAAMQQAEKNIDEMLEDLNRSYHNIRQSSIDEELFDIVSGFEALGQ